MQRINRYFVKVKQTLKNLLQQGTSPPKLALAMSLGAAIGTFPIIGTNTAILIFLCLIFRLNYVAPQITNYAVYPLQLLMLLPFYQLGSYVTGSAIVFDLDKIIYSFQTHWWQAMQQFGQVIFTAVVGWVILVIPFFAACYFVFLAILQNMQKTDRQKKSWQ